MLKLIRFQVITRLSKGPDYADSEWLSGWIALTFLSDPNMALQHFKNFYNNVGYPISLSTWSLLDSTHLQGNKK